MKKQRVISRKVHMCISVDGVLNKYKRKQINFCIEDDGTPMHPKKARQIFEVARYEGKKVLPMGDDCYRFDYEKGCKGHIKSLMPIDEEMEKIEAEYKKQIISQK